MQQLIRDVFVRSFGDPLSTHLHDGATWPVSEGTLAFSTDSYVVQPLFFPGGDIGSLAVHGTVNDLAMCGAKPLWLSVGFILEEGLAIETLERIVDGAWYQGEIAGNYPLSNGNTNTHMLRLKVTPREDVTVNVIYYNITLDEAGPFGETYVTSDDFGDEIDLTVEWQTTDEIYVIGVVGFLEPGDAAEEWVSDGETYFGEDDWVYTMLYVSYSL